MFTFLSVLAGVLIALTVAQNGQLAGFYGNYSASVLIHATGLVAVLIVRQLMVKKLPAKQSAKPWMFLGGVIGVATTIFLVTAFSGVGVTAIVGLGLLGQIIASMVVDQFGLMGAQKSPFFAKRLFALVTVLLGAAVMLFPMAESSWICVLLALASGATTVVARTINGQLAKRQGPLRSTVMNYVTGLVTTVFFLLLAGRGEPMMTHFTLSPNLFMYLGGTFGVGLVMLMNLTVNKVPAFKLTLLQFSGQVFTGLVLDALIKGAFSWQSAIGGALVAIGLCLDSHLTRQRQSAA